MATNTLPGRTTPTLTGNGTDDYLFGSSDNDIISGGTGVGTGTDGSDTMEGGAGDDVYIVNDTTDVVIETAGEGDDTVYTAVSYTLPDNVENIGSTKKGTTGIVLTGNAMDNTLDGSQSSNPDTLQGLAGNDTYFLGNDTSASALTNDVVFEGQWATPTTVAGTAIATTSPATGAAMLWTDTAGTDTVSATNTIDLSQSVVKVSSASTVAVTGSGSTAAIVPSATIAANILAASDAAYTVATTLVTPTSFGIGTIVNGTAITVATLEPVGAVVVTSPTAGFTLAQLNAISPVVRGASAIENVFLTGGSVAAGGTSTATGPNITGNALNNRLIGDTDQNVILGGAGNDTLDGGNDLSADTLTGSKGDDTYIVRVSTEGTGSSIDLVTELANEGTDTVRSYATYTLPNNVENLILMAAKNASGTALNGTGNALANSIQGVCLTGNTARPR